MLQPGFLAGKSFRAALPPVGIIWRSPVALARRPVVPPAAGCYVGNAWAVRPVGVSA